jgi:hypothetical protein
MKRCLNIVVIAATLMLLVGACTITPDTYTIATVDDHRITLKDLQDDPGFRQMVDNSVMKLLIFDAASAKGISITKAQVDEEMEKMMEQFGSEEALMEFLEGQGATMEFVREYHKFMLTFNELLKSKVDITDEEVQAEFELNPEYYREQYARESDLTVDEAENLTFEDLKEYVVDQLKMARASMLGESTIDELKANADIDYLYLPPEERAKIKAVQEKEKPEPIEVEEPTSVTIEENGSGEEAAADEEADEESEISAESAEEAPEDGEDATSETEGDAAEADAETGETEVEDESSDG